MLASMTSGMKQAGSTATPIAERPALSSRLEQFVSLLRIGLAATLPDRGRLLGTLFLAILIGILETALLLLLATIAISLTHPKGMGAIYAAGFAVHATTSLFVTIAGGVTVALIVLAYPLAQLQAALSSRAIVRTRERILHAYLRANSSYRETHDEGYFQQLIGDYCTRAETTVQQFATVGVTLSTLAVILTGAIVASPKTALALLIGLLASAVVASPLARQVRQMSSRNAAANRDIASQAAQTARLSEEIAAYHVIDPVEAELDARIRSAGEQLHQVRLQGRLVPNLHQYATIAIVLLVIGAEIYLVPRMHPGLASLALLLVRAMTYARQLLSAAHTGGEAIPYLEAINKELLLLDANRIPADGRTLTQFSGITLSQVGFEYPGQPPVLRDVSLSVRPGEIVGVMGPSGGGKSTLCALLLRLKDPTSGLVRTGDINLRQVSAASWSGMTAFAPQDSKLIRGTVADNIRFFRADYGQEQIEAVARAANIHDEIIALPQGYDTIIGPGERGLSGGQRQRVAIARALLGGPKLLVLDEPTSALDRESEVLISRTLDGLRGSVAVVLVAHRPAILRACDRVLNLTDGRLADAAEPIEA
jgi:ABC-type multidrug transport system fused ATPase/permease subunit